MGAIPGLRLKISYTAWHSQKTKLKEKKKDVWDVFTLTIMNATIIKTHIYIFVWTCFQ